jgi:hypothetical protein
MTEQETIDDLNSLVGKHIYFAYKHSGLTNKTTVSEPFLTGLCKLKKVKNTKNVTEFTYAAIFNDYASILFSKEDILNKKCGVISARESFKASYEEAILSLPESIKTED